MKIEAFEKTNKSSKKQTFKKTNEQTILVKRFLSNHTNPTKFSLILLFIPIIKEELNSTSNLDSTLFYSSGNLHYSCPVTWQEIILVFLFSINYSILFLFSIFILLLVILICLITLKRCPPQNWMEVLKKSTLFIFLH